MHEMVGCVAAPNPFGVWRDVVSRKRFLSDLFASEEFIFASARPRRGYMAFFRRWYDLIIAACVTLLLLVTITPYAPKASVLVVGLYLAYFLSKQVFRLNEARRSRYASKHFQLLRAIMTIVGVTALQVYLYLYTDFIASGGLDHTLWLLLLLGTLLVSQRGSTLYVFITLGFALASLVGTTVLATALLPARPASSVILADLIEKGMWLTLLSFNTYLVVRIVGDLYADVGLLHEVTDDMLEQEQRAILATDSRPLAASHSAAQPMENGLPAILKAVVTYIQRNYDFPHVNIFMRMPDGALECVAAASPAGQALVDAHYRLPELPSLVRRAALSADAVLCNNTDDADDYLSHPVFEQTKAELATPISRDGRTLGVLDIQAHDRQAFLQQDADVMGVLSAQLARTIDNVTAHRWRRRYGEIVQAMAKRLLSQSELGSTLQEIVEGVRESLEADSVLLYERDPQTGAVSSPTYAGELVQRRMLHAPTLHPEGLMAQLLIGSQREYYNDDILNNPPEPPFDAHSRRRSPDRPTFEEREKVRAHAVYLLYAGYDCVGVLFVNFLRPQEFTPSFKKAAGVFADLAALAIRQGQLDEREKEFQRKDFGDLMHDQFGAITRSASKGIEEVLQRVNMDDTAQQRLSGCKEALDEMSLAISYLHQSLEDAAERTLSAEAQAIAERVHRIHNIPVEVDWPRSADDMPPRHVMQVRLMLEELVLNALRHGKATHLRLACSTTKEGVQIVIHDNGVGFDPAYVEPRGLRHARMRAERLGGQCEVETAVGAGTRIVITLPL